MAALVRRAATAAPMVPTASPMGASALRPPSLVRALPASQSSPLPGSDEKYVRPQPSLDAVMVDAPPATPAVAKPWHPKVGGPKPDHKRRHNHDDGHFHMDDDISDARPMKHVKFYDKETSDGREGGGYKGGTEGHTHHMPRIDMKGSAYSRVRRAYRTNVVKLGNTNGSSYSGVGCSFKGTYDATNDTISPHVNYGGPVNGTTVPGIVFPNLPEEYAWFSKVFQYARITKFQMNVVRFPQMIMQGLAPDGSGNNQNVGWNGSLMDPGVIVLRPWAGETNEASFTDGSLSGTNLIDHQRRRLAKTFKACSPHGDQEIAYQCVRPFSVVDLDEDAQDGPTEVIYKPTGAVEYGRFRTAQETHNSYGHILYWYYPMCSAATTNTLQLGLYWEVEFEWFGMQVPQGLPEPDLPEGQVYEDDAKAQFADKYGLTVVKRPAQKPVPEPPVVPLPAACTGVGQAALYQEQQSAAPAGYVVVSEPPAKP